MRARLVRPTSRRAPRAGRESLIRCRNARSLVLLLAAGVLTLHAQPLEVERQDRLRRVQGEIARLQGELRALGDRERGVLGDVQRLDTELRLRAAEREDVALRLEGAESAIDVRTRELERLEREQERRRRYLAFRLREIYKGGPDQTLRRLLGGERVDQYLGAMRYAAHLGQRDARVLREFRQAADRLSAERAAWVVERDVLRDLQGELTRAQSRLRSARKQRGEMLARIRQDQATRRTALQELEGAAVELTRAVQSFADAPGEVPQLDVRKFRGLLEWPADGDIGAGFGSVIHPRFKTEVPHPGWDIEAAAGEDIRSVFDGRVVFASWMRGYGLTAIVDHGHGVLSIYAHASALVVETGQRVHRGALLGKVGESGSLRGPYLYFELRVDGRPIDPVGWLRRR